MRDVATVSSNCWTRDHQAETTAWTESGVCCHSASGREMSDGLSIDHYTKEYEKKTERENIYAKLGPGKNSSHRED